MPGNTAGTVTPTQPGVGVGVGAAAGACVIETAAACDARTTLIFYKDVTQAAESKSSVKCTDREILHLPEFQKLGDVECATSMGRDVIHMIVQHDAVIIDLDAIAKMRTLTGIMDSLVQAQTRSTSDSTQTVHAQHMATKEFVYMHKCDTAETLASTCVDTVYTFLKSVKRLAHINRNRIGGDLVALGVKKTRKTKGNVYGLLLSDRPNDHTNE